MYAELLKELIESRKKYFVADSINAEEEIGYTDEQLSEVIRESMELTSNLFSEMCEVEEVHENIHNPRWGYNDQEDLCWCYSPEENMYYFYR